MTDIDKTVETGPEPKRAGWEGLLRSELENILINGHFQKSPTLQRLLIYLVGETIRGGDKLKSYVVAVDGLGKDPQFDSHTDSYPRVQVMRLRKMLEGYYARHRPLKDMCIHIPAGSYEVKLARPASAYPEIFSRPATAEPSSATAVSRMSDTRIHAPISFHPQNTSRSETPSQPITASTDKRWRLILLWLMPAIVLAAVVGGYYAGFSRAPPANDLATPALTDAPILRLGTPAAAPNPETRAIAAEAYAKLADGIGRSWAVRLSLNDANEPDFESDPGYHLTVQVGELRDGQRAVYLRLTEHQNAELIWSTSVPLDPEKSLADNLGKSIAQVAGPFGIIAARETSRTNGEYTKGYSCLLGYMHYLNTRNPELMEPLSTCLERPTENVRLNAVRLALQSFHTVASATLDDRPAATTRALSVAQQAIQTDPKEAYAHFAMARIHYVTGDCAKGALHTSHAAQANPYDPVMLAVLGNFAAQCGNPLGEALLDRAFDFRSPGESYARLSLILSAIRSGRLDRLPALSAESENSSGLNAAYHHLCETLVAAATGNNAKAKSEWKKFAAVSADPNGQPDSMLRDVVLSPQIRKKVIVYLATKNVL